MGKVEMEEIKVMKNLMKMIIRKFQMSIIRRSHYLAVLLGKKGRRRNSNKKSIRISSNARTKS